MPIGTYTNYIPAGSSRIFKIPTGGSPSHGPENFQQYSDQLDTDLTSELAAKASSADLATKANLAATINAKITSYTLVEADNGEVITMDVATANILTVPAGLSAGFNSVIIQKGAGQTTIAAPGAPLATPGLKLRAQGSWAGILHLGSDAYSVGGDLSA